MDNHSQTTWQEARDVLDDARQWRHHNPTGWTVVDRYLDQLETAAARSDAEAAIRAVTELELMSPCRCDSPSRPDATGIPADTLDFLNHVDNLAKDNLDAQT